MLLLSSLFTVVAGIFLYSLRKDTGKHTKYARSQSDLNVAKSETTALPETRSLHSGTTDTARAA
ncbi:hypothetical protein [Alteromonas sp. BMJM2]|uniref:hypothetical protein n=1 Tax=Alteromonas sp. BMJM2 TaxID=2954241 RepID=UPI0022B47079|nr:hypothetical protein [Alteromonas sp. BMJM2]